LNPLRYGRTDKMLQLIEDRWKNPQNLTTHHALRYYALQIGMIHTNRSNIFMKGGENCLPF